jgi:hypothetical protein
MIGEQQMIIKGTEHYVDSDKVETSEIPLWLRLIIWVVFSVIIVISSLIGLILALLAWTTAIQP